MPSFSERRLEFHFAEGWQVIKYDDGNALPTMRLRESVLCGSFCGWNLIFQPPKTKCSNLSCSTS